MPPVTNRIDCVDETGREAAGFTYEPTLLGPRVVAQCTREQTWVRDDEGWDISSRLCDLLPALSGQSPDGGVFVGHVVDGPTIHHLLTIDGLLPTSPAPFTPTSFSAAQRHHFIATDILGVGIHDVRQHDWEVRRRLLATFLAHRTSPIHVVHSTKRLDLARRWLRAPQGLSTQGLTRKSLNHPHNEPMVDLTTLREDAHTTGTA